VFLSLNDEVFFYKKMNGESREQETEWKFIPKMVFGDITDIKFTLNVKSDCYRGLDQEIPINFKLKYLKDIKRVTLSSYVRLFPTIKKTKN
jgi:translocation protein SEC63